MRGLTTAAIVGLTAAILQLHGKSSLSALAVQLQEIDGVIDVHADDSNLLSA